MPHSDIINRHERIALQLSGGKDSLACLFLMRPWLDRITVYWLNTGRPFPETLRTIEDVRRHIPHFVEITSDVDSVHAQCGIPSDVVPAAATPLGRLVGHDAPAIQDRYSCCFQTIMRPLHERMLADGITLIIRGQRNDDPLKPALRSGMVDGGIEYLLPIEDWSARRVLDYLKAEGAPIPRFYQMLVEAPDCMTCSAWWEKGAAKYLKRYHHEQYQEVQRRLDVIREAVGQHIAHFNDEVNT
jgi:3'-phosphoadenosine 5'-phosphosulfate sulfotransferase (PAPS reductase)/FAD synthetase